MNIDDPFENDEFFMNEDIQILGTLVEKKNSLNFENTMKCIKDLSYSSLFTNNRSKKFHFKSLA